MLKKGLKMCVCGNLADMTSHTMPLSCKKCFVFTEEDSRCGFKYASIECHGLQWRYKEAHPV
jgi:hypothetical protein